jgi:GNAT superfamily N-acetyltransferase
MPTSVQPLDAWKASDADLFTVHELLAAAHAEANPVEPYRSFEDTAAFLRHPPATEPRRYWLAGEEGFAELAVPHESAAGKVQVVVRGAARRRGLGSALLAVVREEAGRLGCRTIMARHATPSGAAFAAAVGGVDTRPELRSLLRLSDAELESQAPHGYRLQSWVGPTPDALLSSYADARNSINDAPMATEGDWEHWDVARIRDLETAVDRRDRDVRVTVALDTDGAVVGFTELRVSRSPGPVATTEDSAVRREHRGKGVARAVKVESLRRLRADRPDVEFVTTMNAESNDAILALNRSVGFRAIARYTTCVVEL